MALINLGWNTRGFFWDGRAATLEDLVFQPVTNPIEMNAKWPDVTAKLNAHTDYPQLFKQAFDADVIDSTHVSKAISQFLRTLISGRSRMDQFMQHEIQLNEQELRGYIIFNNETADCFHCHGLGGGLNTDNKFHNNGLDTVFNDPGRYAITGDPTDLGHFRTPTLRNIELTAPYMHDGRFFTLEEVVDHYSEHVKMSSTVDPLMELVGFGGAHLSDDDKLALVAFLRTFTDQNYISNPEFADPGQ
jgi:cytochrome c peroxidase